MTIEGSKKLKDRLAVEVKMNTTPLDIIYCNNGGPVTVAAEFYLLKDGTMRRLTRNVVEMECFFSVFAGWYSTDGRVQVVNAEVDSIYEVRRNAGTKKWERRPFTLPVITEGMTIRIVYDEFRERGCVLTVDVYGRNYDLKVTNLFNDIDFEAGSVRVRRSKEEKSLDELLAAMDDEATVSVEASQPEEHDSGEQPEEQPQPQPEEAESMEPEGRSENFAEQTPDDNGAEEDPWGGLSQRGINQLLAGAADLESSDDGGVDNSVETVDEGGHF